MAKFTFENLGKESFTQDDGAVWTAFYDQRNPDQRYLIVTSSGRELFLHGDLPFRALKRAFHQYRAAEQGPGSKDTREFLGSGQQAEVFGLNAKLAVRETGGNETFYHALSDLTRQDRLISIVEGGLPRWINVPHTYALYSDTEAGRQYALMDRIDSGVTVQDIVDFDEVNNHSQQRVLKELGRKPTEQDASEIGRLFDKAGNILNTVISARGYDPTEILTDWQTRNVIVEPLATPVGGEWYSLNIIDQN